ncbi:tyrosine--tRNA ligase [Candidatus Azambacteria bacterium RIFCSPHIGHO2_01_FULL_44_55]|uniref:Tyrosine--tRNA ligase n=1 Tax=Candidatus Azambacteria bacterium RIFCSPLOWO2_02_FULL_44_14 TaxID=1797306 RepID=A0A1F5CB33_9BACT|nr:MAG: tyrosine--tRNA ligase [Candidatus Azambacteria bacterium RIFCSPLOWO2_01_FULL_44_84]OGD33029.1 MAG: tyrosine--tRNA ligase [Candidatus Azambacteria bacterium RIFCSPHIGHO2_02_FULL_45_18]OGD40074.1 MAG: tyrosine--tRNA ligase [Candidatus Azambacteria bacterium RIFCSPLOWO2_02_FULL_44_14]OGD40920.1 MAG: tyrosine--tRNA ligase [Candidatus Azambacteria bacterium RIFCSPHIGHO2_01_FULL_44_55]OGD52174.1 MAG: tyrosine--tRNA ligase [Candidatus Azambacteria bacterium RIFOXYD1_FULL_44_10]
MAEEKNQLIKETLTRQVAEIYPSREMLEKALKSRKKLTIYWGIDPTSPDVHLGHSTNLFILKRFQDLGHKVIILIGDYTAQIGDPAGKDKVRKVLTESEVKRNYKTYKNQILKILDPKKTLFRFNSEWWGKMSAKKLLEIDDLFTHQQVIERDMFQRRIKENKPISIKEFQYPLLQGYDSVALKTDIELGATDQLFNMLAGRELEKIYLKKEKIVITTPLLINPKTGNKLMSKSEGNYISLQDSANQMYGKAMALPDEVILDCFRFCTDLPEQEIKNVEKQLESGGNPRDAKTKLAHEIVAIYHGVKKAEEAAHEFHKIFIDKELPGKISAVSLKAGPYPIVDLLVKTGLASSKSEARRLVEQGAVKIDRGAVKDIKAELKISGSIVVQVGKRNFRKIITK